MARNRNSHETRKKILEVSKNLFLEKGFDNTSIQDIIDGLGGLTKGVIYHHLSLNMIYFKQSLAKIIKKF